MLRRCVALALSTAPKSAPTFSAAPKLRRRSIELRTAVAVLALPLPPRRCGVGGGIVRALSSTCIDGAVSRASTRPSTRCFLGGGGTFPYSESAGGRCGGPDGESGEPAAAPPAEGGGADCAVNPKAASVAPSSAIAPASNLGLDWDHPDRSEIEEETMRLIGLMDSAPTATAWGLVADDLSRVEKADFDRVMDAWSKWREMRTDDDADDEDVGLIAAERAESLLLVLETNHDRLMEEANRREAAASSSSLPSAPLSWALIPSALSYNFVLHAHASSGGGTVAAERAGRVLDRMIRRCRERMDGGGGGGGAVGGVVPPPPEPTTATFNAAINAWAKSGDHMAGREAEEVFRTMERWRHDCKARVGTADAERGGGGGSARYAGCLPDVRSFSGVIDAWANSGAGPSGADRVRAILDRLIHMRREAVSVAAAGVGGNCLDGVVVRPNVILFNSVINAISKSGQGSRGAEIAEDTVRVMEELHFSGEMGPGDEDDLGLMPNTRTLTLVLDAWANCELEGEDATFAARRADAVLTRMEELYNKGYDVKPNVVSFTTCITAWSRCAHFDDAAAKAESILDRMIKLYEFTGDEEIRPNTTTFNSVITAWARNRDADSVRRAEAVLERLESFGKSDTTSFNALIDAYAKSHGNNGSGDKAAALLERMEAKGLTPDMVTYSSIIDALAKDRGRDAARRADQLLQRLEGSKGSKLQLSSYSYTSCINAYSRSSEPRKAEKARALLQRLIDRSNAGKLDGKPDIYAFSACLHACANVNGNNAERREALKVAIRTFEELKRSPQYGEPNAFTYGAMVKACSRLTADAGEKGRLLDIVFRECCEAGCVSKHNLEQFQRGAPNSLREKFLHDDGLVPSEWCHNVRKRDRPHCYVRTTDFDNCE